MRLTNGRIWDEKPTQWTQGLQRPVCLAQNRSVKYGYARVSTEDQNASMQRTALKKFGCQKIFTDDGQSGATTNRPEFQKCLKKLAPGDSLTVWKLDRLGRSLRDLIIVLDDFKERGIKFRSLTENIDTETPTGRAMWQMIGVLAELERSQIKERTQAGIAAAKARGVQFGRKKKLKPYQVQEIRKRIRSGEAPSDVAESFNIGRSTLYWALAG
jgi:DNA invertase Pin-like site-specific DNA recombinase